MKNALAQLAIAALLLLALVMNLHMMKYSTFDLLRMVGWYTSLMAVIGFVHFAYDGLLDLWYELDYIRYIRTHR